MSAQFYVKETKRAVDAIRSRLAPLGLFQDDTAAIAIEDFASIAGECRIVRLSDLTEERGLAHLSKAFGVRVGDHTPSPAPLAGALCVADRARLRWILVRAEDIPTRQRFTIAHELGHLFLEVEPSMIDSGQSSLGLEGGADVASTVRMYSRCAAIEEAPPEATRASRHPLSKADLLEVKADHFASELLMPYAGVTRLIREVVGSRGIGSERDIAAITSALAQRYDVSAAAARRRLVKDLGVVAIDDNPNRDLFG